jgi:hypothetical protein
MSFIDSQSRKLLNYFFMMQERTSPRSSTMWCRKILVNRAIGKMYMPYPRLRLEGQTYRFKNVTFNIDEFRKIPDLAALLDEYDGKSKQIKKKMRETQQKIVMNWRDQEEEKLMENVSNKIDKLTQVKNKIIGYPEPYINAKGNLDIDLICAVEGINRNDASTVKKIIDKELMTVPTSQASS